MTVPMPDTFNYFYLLPYVYELIMNKILCFVAEKLNVLYERNWTMLVHEQLRRFEGSIVAATRHGGFNNVGRVGGGTSNAAIAGRFGGNHMDALIEARWTFSEALLYSVTVITTIGMREN